MSDEVQVKIKSVEESFGVDLEEGDDLVLWNDGDRDSEDNPPFYLRYEQEDGEGVFYVVLNPKKFDGLKEYIELSNRAKQVQENVKEDKTKAILPDDFNDVFGDE